MALTATIILVFVFLAGLSIGAAVTTIAMSARRPTIVESRGEPPTVNDLSNPYAPSNVQSSVVRARTGCGLASVIAAILGGLMVMVVVAWMTAGATVVTPAPIPLPRTTAQPSPPPPATIPANE